MLITVTGVLYAALWLAFLVGFKKKISYGLIFLLHAIGTLLTLPKLIINVGNFQILFLAAIPAAMAMLLLWKLRDHDTMLTLGK